MDNEKNRRAFEHFRSVRERIDEICKPLSYLGIEIFTYGKIFKDGYYHTVGNCGLKYAEIYISSVMDQGSYFQKTTEEAFFEGASYSFLLGRLDRFDKKIDPTVYLRYDFGIWNLFGIHRLTKEGLVEYASFACEPSRNLSKSFYIKILPLLERFIEYFKEKAADIIDTEDKSKLAYMERASNIDLISRFLARSPEEKTEETVAKFLEETTLKRIKTARGNVPLSNREYQCLEYLALGRTTKEVAGILDLSPRTVEAYLDSVKKKTGYFSKSKLVTEFIESAPSTFLKYRKD